MGTNDIQVIKQHLIDPEICIRCNTCEAICPVGAITHDSRNYVVDAEKCNLCMACVSPCPTGSIDNWRDMPRVRAYSVEEQLSWDVLPAPLPEEELAAAGSQSDAAPAQATQTGQVAAPSAQAQPTTTQWMFLTPSTTSDGVHRSVCHLNASLIA